MLSILCAAFLAGFASTPQDPANVSVTTAEVATYVRANWAQYAPRVANQLGTEQLPELVSLTVTECEVYQTAECELIATVSFGDEFVRHTFRSAFARKADGSVAGAIKLSHDRTL